MRRRRRVFEALDLREMLDGSGLVSALTVGNPPVIDEFSTEIGLEYAEGTVDLGKQFATDVEDDAAGIPLTWSIGPGDEEFFVMTPDGYLSFIAPPDFENPITDNFFVVEIIATDSDGNSDFLYYSIAITDVSEHPVIEYVHSDFSVGGAEPTQLRVPAGNTELAEIHATDDEDDFTNGLPLHWSVAGQDASLFSIEEGQLSFIDAANYNPNGDNLYVVDIVVEDSDRQTVVRTIEVEVTPAPSVPSFDVSGNVATIVGADDGEWISLSLGNEVHYLQIDGDVYEFDATVVNTFHIGAGLPDSYDTILIAGTERDDDASAFDDTATFVSNDYEVTAYSFDRVIFDGSDGQDYAQIYGSDADDTLEGFAFESSLVTPTHEFLSYNIERVDAYGRGGDDYAQLYGTSGSDRFLTYPTYEVLRGGGMQHTTKGFERIDAYGRGGSDFARLQDSPDDDFVYAFENYVVSQRGHRKAVAIGFEKVVTPGDQGGSDIMYLRDMKSTDAFYALYWDGWLLRSNQTVDISDFEIVELRAADGETPTVDLFEFYFDVTGDV